MESEKMQDFEKSVAFLKTWGPFQRRIIFLLCLTAVPCGYNILCVIFLLAIPHHHCLVPTDSNLTQEWIAAIIPVQLVVFIFTKLFFWLRSRFSIAIIPRFTVVIGQPERSSCSRYELDLVRNLSAMGARPISELARNLSALGGPEILLSNLSQEGCKDGWTYSTEHYQSTVVTEFNLVCSDQWKQPLTSSVYILGGLCGCLVSGQISDRFGRKPVLFGSIALLSIFSFAVAFAPSWPVFTALFFMMGLGQIASYVTGFVLGSEFLVGRPRVLFSNLCLPSVYVISSLMLPVTAYMVTHWRHLSLILAIPGLLCIPLWWVIPESPRWLVSRGRVWEAERVLRSAAVQNQVEAPQVIFPSADVEKVESQRADSLGFFDLLRTKSLRNLTLLLWFTWFSINLSYFGVSFNMSSLYGNPFFNYLLLTFVDMPAYLIGWLAARRLPRRMSFMGFNLLGALALLLIQVSLRSSQILTLCLVLLGKFGTLAGIGILFTMTNEMSPTVIRSTAMSSSVTFSRVGFAVSPYLLQLSGINQFLPWIIVGGLALLSFVVCMFLPETFRQPLPDTIQQMPYRVQFSWPWTATPPPVDDGKSSENQAIASDIVCTTYL